MNLLEWKFNLYNLDVNNDRKRKYYIIAVIRSDLITLYNTD